MNWKFLLASSLVGAFASLGGHALAQQAAGASTVGEVVVTAQKRTERLIDVPITVAVVSGAQLTQRGVTDTSGLQKMTAGVVMAYNTSFLSPAIRGISSAVTNQALPTNIAIYLDGSYIPSQVGGTLDLPDVQDVEILKGPQGTLYGENAEGGAVVITTLDPKFRWQGNASVSYGNYNDVHIRGFETGPITDSIAQSLAGSFENCDGFFTDLYTGKRRPGLKDALLRGKLLFQPNDKIALTFTAYWNSHVDHDVAPTHPFYLPGYGYETVARNYDRNGQLLASAAPNGRSTLPYNLAGLGPWNSGNEVPAELGLRSWGGSLKGVFDVGLGKLTWLSSYANSLSNIPYYYSNSNILAQFDNPPEPSKTIIEQGDFISRSFKPFEAIGPIEFSTGLFYMHFEEAFNNVYTAWSAPAFGALFLLPSLPLSNAGHQPTPLFREIFYAPAVRETFAGYLEVTWHVTPALSLTGGGRYSTETEHVYFDACLGADPVGVPITNLNHGTVPTPDCPGGANLSSHVGNIGAPSKPLPVTELLNSPETWNNFSPHAVVRYKFNPDMNVYFSFSEGFRGGGINGGGLAKEEFKPETLTSYEVGFKGALFDHRLQINLSGFHSVYKNKVEAINLSVAGGGTDYVVTNAAAANNDGADLDATWVATPQLNFNASVEWLQATFADYPGATIFVPTSVGGMPAYVPGRAVPGMMVRGTFDLTNHVEERAPRWSGTAGVDYHVNTEYGRFQAIASVYFSSKAYLNSDSFAYQDSYALVDASLAWTPVSLPNLRVVLWGRNLGNTAVYTSEQASPSGTGVGIGPPRQFGGRLEYKF